MYIHIHDLYILIGEYTYCLAHKWNQFALCFRFELGMAKWITNHNKLWESSTKGRSGASEDMASSTAEFRAKLIEKLTLGVAQSLGKVHGTARFQELTRAFYCLSSYITFTVKILIRCSLFTLQTIFHIHFLIFRKTPRCFGCPHWTERTSWNSSC